MTKIARISIDLEQVTPYVRYQTKTEATGPDGEKVTQYGPEVVSTLAEPAAKAALKSAGLLMAEGLSQAHADLGVKDAEIAALKAELAERPVTDDDLRAELAASQANCQALLERLATFEQAAADTRNP